MTRAKQALAIAAITIAVGGAVAAPALADNHSPRSGGTFTTLDHHVPVSGDVSQYVSGDGSVQGNHRA